MSHFKPITIEGIHFESTRAAAKYYNVSPRTVQTRLYKGWTRQQALGVMRPPTESIKATNIWLQRQGTGTKVCRECKEEKSLDEFYKRAKEVTSSICKICFPFYNRRREHNITRKEWERIFKNQNNKCAICGSAEHNGRNWHTDHCHITNKIRGILCGHCNHMLGHAQDNTETLKSAIEYLNNSIKLEDIHG